MPFTAEQVKTLLDATAKDRLGVLYLTAVATGLRQGELLALRWSDVDLDAFGTVTVRHTLQRGTRTLAEPKTDRARRIVPLPRRVIDALTTHRTRQRRERIAAGPRWHDDGHVFATLIGTALDPRNVLRRYHAALTAAGLPAQSFHALRHAYATLQLAQEQLANVSKLLGHANLSTTSDLYAHLAPATERRAADSMDRLPA